MINVLVNFYHSNSGGGKVIFENFLRQINKKNEQIFYFVLVNNVNSYHENNFANIKIIGLPLIFKNGFSIPFIYYLYLPFLLAKYKIDVLLNFADLLYPYPFKQIYFFDWAYVSFTDKHVWSKMPLSLYLIRSIKSFLIKFHINSTSKIICQTDYMSSELINKLNVCHKKIIVIKTPHSIAYQNNLFEYSKKISRSFTSKFRFFYPSSYSSHKNFNLILQLGKIIQEKRLNIEFVLTIDIKNSQDFWDSVKENNLNCIITLGPLNHSKVIDEYYNSDALFFPSLLESYGFPLIEAMTVGIPILVSDLPFAKSLCYDAVFYFNPYNCNDAIITIEKFINKKNVDEFIQKGKKYSNSIIKWNEFHNQIEAIITSI